MVAAGCDKGVRCCGFGAVEHRHDHRHIGQMRAAPKGIVEDIGIAAQHTSAIMGLVVSIASARFDNALNAVAHRSKMDRNMRRIGNESAAGVKQSAGKIEPFLNVHRGRGGLQHNAHFLGDGHEQIVENFEPYRISLGPSGIAPFERLVTGEGKRAIGQSLRLPALFDDSG